MRRSAGPYAGTFVGHVKRVEKPSHASALWGCFRRPIVYVAFSIGQSTSSIGFGRGILFDVDVTGVVGGGGSGGDGEYDVRVISHPSIVIIGVCIGLGWNWRLGTWMAIAARLITMSCCWIKPRGRALIKAVRNRCILRGGAEIGCVFSEEVALRRHAAGSVGESSAILAGR